MNLIKLKCENCGATLEANKDLDKINCNFCGSEILIDDEATELRRLENAKLQARQQNHEQTLKERQEKLEQDLKEKEIIEQANAKEKFKKSKFSKFLLVFFAFSVIYIFFATGFWAKALSVIQSILFILAWLMGMEIVKEPTKGLRTILAIIAFVLIVPIISIDGSDTVTKKYETINWNYIILNEHLPQPKEEKGKIYSNDDDDLRMYVSVDSEDGYRQYIQACKDFGYTINAKNGTNSYDAYNSDNYKLSLYYYKSSNEYSISLDYKPNENTSNSNNSKSEESTETISETPAETNEEATSTNNSNNLRSDFKVAMDSYESFMDEYIAFMKKYTNNPTDMPLVNDYTNYLNKYNDLTDKFEKWNDGNLNNAELKYYIEVQQRVNKKLTDAAVSKI